MVLPLLLTGNKVSMSYRIGALSSDNGTGETYGTAIALDGE